MVAYGKCKCGLRPFTTSVVSGYFRVDFDLAIAWYLFELTIHYGVFP